MRVAGSRPQGPVGQVSRGHGARAPRAWGPAHQGPGPLNHPNLSNYDFFANLLVGAWRRRGCRLKRLLRRWGPGGKRSRDTPPTPPPPHGAVREKGRGFSPSPPSATIQHAPQGRRTGIPKPRGTSLKPLNLIAQLLFLAITGCQRTSFLFAELESQKSPSVAMHQTNLNPKPQSEPCPRTSADFYAAWMAWAGLPLTYWVGLGLRACTVRWKGTLKSNGNEGPKDLHTVRLGLTCWLSVGKAAIVQTIENTRLIIR